MRTEPKDFKHHSELINYLMRLRGLEEYLEIGTFNREHNFEKVKAVMKLCVDPDPNAKADYVGTSDDFFVAFKELGYVNHKVRRHIYTFDTIFIDGLHTADQVRKDFDNALSVLKADGFIVMHDCKPPTEKTTCVPRGDQREWCGDVYKFASRLGEYNDIDFRTMDFDYGCTVVWKSPGKVGVPVGEVTWERFEKEQKELLRLISLDEITQIQ